MTLSAVVTRSDGTHGVELLTTALTSIPYLLPEVFRRVRITEQTYTDSGSLESFRIEVDLTE